MEERTEIPPGTLYMLVLKTLLRVGPMHGYGIAQHIQQISKEVLQVEEGSLYPALQRMLIKGWVTGEWRQSENNRRARFYSLTPKGRKQLAAEIAEFEKVTAAITRVIQPRLIWTNFFRQTTLLLPPAPVRGGTRGRNAASRRAFRATSVWQRYLTQGG